MKLPLRKADSHKGQNGKVLVIGGNEVFHGAPLLTARGAEKSGVDLVFVAVPPAQALPLKMANTNFIVHEFSGAHLRAQDIPLLLSIADQVDLVAIGNGLGKEPETQAALLSCLAQMRKSLVLDGESLFPEIFTVQSRNSWILTPHEGEFMRLFKLPGTAENVWKVAKKYRVTILKKGEIDFIADEEQCFENTTGVPQMTVGGTGDALAGITAGFWAQGLSAIAACHSAAYFWGRCGEKLAATRFSFSAWEMLEELPRILKEESIKMEKLPL